MNLKFNVAKAMFLASTATLLFLYGVAVAEYRIFPYEWLRFGKHSVDLVSGEFRTLLGVRPDAFLRPARHPGSGTTVLRTDAVSPGLTLVAGFFDDRSELRLIELDGHPVQRWPVRFSELFPDPVHLPTARIPRTDWNIDIHGAAALSDGSVVFNLEYGGMVKLDRCGDVEWTVPLMTHHSIDVASDGSFWVPGRSHVASLEGFPDASTEYAVDEILRISSSGEILTQVSVIDMFIDNGLRGLLIADGHMDAFPRDAGEIVHLNDIEELSPSLADRFPMFQAGDLLLSFRHRNLLMVVEPETWMVKWYQIGPWIRQHDPDFTADGTILVFNNNADDHAGSLFGGSNIIEFHPGTGAMSYRYGVEADQDIYTNIRGKHQPLPNGNILITEFGAGRLIEIDSTGAIVWEYISRYDEEHVTELTGAIRYAPTYFEVGSWAC